MGADGPHRRRPGRDRVWPTSCAGPVSMASPGSLRGGDNIARPMLDITRSETRELATLAGLPWTDDPSNADLGPLRNRIRLAADPASRGRVQPRCSQASGRWPPAPSPRPTSIDPEPGEDIQRWVAGPGRGSVGDGTGGGGAVDATRRAQAQGGLWARSRRSRRGSGRWCAVRPERPSSPVDFGSSARVPGFRFAGSDHRTAVRPTTESVEQSSRLPIGSIANWIDSRAAPLPFGPRDGDRLAGFETTHLIRGDRRQAGRDGSPDHRRLSRAATS